MKSLKKLVLGWSNVWSAIFGFVLGGWQNKLEVESNVIIFALVFFALLSALAFIWRRHELEPNIRATPIPDDTAQERHARRGIVVFLSLYKMFPSKTDPTRLKDEEIPQCLENLDYKTLRLDQPD